MFLTHLCPLCGKTHEMDQTPEPSKCCPECVDRINQILTYEFYHRMNSNRIVGINEERSWNDNIAKITNVIINEIETKRNI